MSDSKMREDFEDWFGKTWPDSAMVAHEHKEAIKLAWNASWRASRNAAVVDLPIPGYEVADSHHTGQCQYRERATIAIEAAGLKVKP